jgi:cell division protein FtsB
VTADAENLVLAQLRAMRNENLTRHDGVMWRLDVLTMRVSSLESQVAQMHGSIGRLHEDMAGVHARLDRLAKSFERAESRLGLSEAGEQT